MYVEKAAKTKFVQKICAHNVDEIDTCETLFGQFSFLCISLANDIWVCSFTVHKKFNKK